MEAIQTSTIRNKKNLESRTPQDREAFRAEISAAMSARDKTREFLRRISMIDSLERAATL